MARMSESEEILMLDLGAQYASIQDEINDAIQRVLATQHFILGENVAALEEEIAAYCAVPYAVGVASGTDALILSLKAAGIGSGDEVIVPAFSFVATADSVSLLGATPVFADIDPVTYNLDASALYRLLSPATRAIVPVHLYGQPAEMEEITAFAARHGLSVLGDAAQALGATCNGVPVCSHGNFGCISFFPSKNLGAYGDAGMIVTRSKEDALQLKMLRSHGSTRKYCSEIQGWNSRLDELQAAILRAKLPHLDRWNDLRMKKAALYNELLCTVEGITLPMAGPHRTHVFHQYTVRLPARDVVRAALTQAGIQTAVHYPVPLHLQPMYRSLGYRSGDLPVAEQAACEVLSLPMYPELPESYIERIAMTLRQAVENTLTVAA